MRDKQTLNIDNTYRSLNLNTRLAYSQLEQVTTVNKLNEDKILKDIEEDKISGRYVIIHSKHGVGDNDTLNAKLMDSGVPISYYTDSTVPLSVMIRLANNPLGEVVYNIKKGYSDEEVDNVGKASMLCKTIVNCPIIYPDVKDISILFSMYDLRYKLDRLELNFPRINKDDYESRKSYYEKTPEGDYKLKDEYKLAYYESLHEDLARWRIQLWLVCENEQEEAYIHSEGVKLGNGIN